TPKQKTCVTDNERPANRTRETKKQEDQKRHAQSAGHNSCKYAQTRDETCRKDCPLTVLEKHLLRIVVPLCHSRETPQKTIDHRSAAVPAKQIAKTGAYCGPGNGGKNRRQ